MHPIRGEMRLVSEEKNISFGASIHNRFDVEVVDPATGKVKQKAQAENVICAAYWSYIVSAATALSYIHYGSGSGTPSANDTALFSFIAAVAPSSSDDLLKDDRTNFVYSIRKKITLSETTAVGKTLTEIGFGYSNTSGTLTTHAMLKDMNGNTISIVKTNTDVINIYATIFLDYSKIAGLIPYEKYASLTHDPFPSNAIGFRENIFKIMVGYTSYIATGSSQFVRLNDPTGAKADVYGLTASYNSTNRTLTIAIPRIPIDSCNWNGIDTVSLWGYPVWTPIMFFSECLNLGSDISNEAIGTGNGSTKDYTTVFSLTSKAKVYLDGVETSDFTLDRSYSHTTNLHFNTAPPNGSVITADYHTDYIAKDNNHVYDLTIVINVNEKAI